MMCITRVSFNMVRKSQFVLTKFQNMKPVVQVSFTYRLRRQVVQVTSPAQPSAAECETRVRLCEFSSTLLLLPPTFTLILLSMYAAGDVRFSLPMLVSLFTLFPLIHLARRNVKLHGFGNHIV
jgi:hypothetical protein